MSEFVKIRRAVGKFTINKPSMTTTEIRVGIPKYSFNHKFTFSGEQLAGIEQERWVDALHLIATTTPKYASTERNQEKLKELLDKHNDEIHEEWLKDRYEHLKEDKKEIEAEMMDIRKQL